MATKTADRDPRIPPAEECVLPAMLDRQAARLGDKVMIVFDEGPTWTYAETRRLARGTAAALHDLGVQRGEMVLVWLPHGQEIVRLSEQGYLAPPVRTHIPVLGAQGRAQFAVALHQFREGGYISGRSFRYRARIWL